ncbi:ROK family transcriptional regulator [Bacillus timonensis]|uniref:ROK family transcriptional regulator n=1 Tax=Bacillus timonensis TaxID=1033734 RepID=UPI000288933C|nr:ROK family transcriptional regulator [Bacillus timonensis]
MDQSITFKDIKKNNYSLIYHLLYQKGKLSKQDIANELNLSLPTVTQNLVRLEKENLIEKNGLFESSVGRRATAYSICSHARISIGVEILKKTVQILAIDLRGETIQQTEFAIRYKNEESYFKEVSQAVREFIAALDVSDDQILGIGFAVQALTSIDGQKITYGKILNSTGLGIDVFTKYLNYPCMFVHDAQCAATTELWMQNEVGDAIYLSIGPHLGGAIILNDKLYMGNEGYSGTVEHMTVNPNGPSCYCGQKGCMETYSSINALLEENESLDIFFQQVRLHTPSYVERWNAFLNHLAYSINNIHLVLNRDFILGGHLAPYLEKMILKYFMIK